MLNFAFYCDNTINTSGIATKNLLNMLGKVRNTKLKKFRTYSEISIGKVYSKQNMGCSIITSDEWCELKEMSQRTEGNYEGYKFNFEINPKLVHYPKCKVETSHTTRGNMIDSNGDYYSTQCGFRAQRLYSFYISDIKKYAVVNCEYWLM